MRRNGAVTYRRRDRDRPGHHLQKPVRLHALAELHQVNGPPVPDAHKVEPPVIGGRQHDRRDHIKRAPMWDETWTQAGTKQQPSRFQ